MANIIELIDSFLPQDIVPIYYLSLPQNTTGMLIEETGIVGEIHSFKGYDGVISSIIQFYSVIDPKDKKYTEMTAILRGFYKKVQEKVGAKKENIKLLYVGSFNMVSNLRDKNNNYIFSLTFPIIYKESE